MIQLIMLIIRVAWLVSSYSLILSTLSGLLPSLVLSITDMPYFDVFFSILVSVVSTIRWIVGPQLFNFAMIVWLVIPAVKLVLYFSHKASTFGDLAPHSINYVSEQVSAANRESEEQARIEKYWADFYRNNP